MKEYQNHLESSAPSFFLTMETILSQLRLKTWIAAAVLNLTSISGAIAASEQEFKDCAGTGSKDLNQIVASCTSVLKETFDDKSITAIALFRRGDAYRFLNDHDKSLRDYDEALRIDPKQGRALFGRGTIYYLRRDYDRALPDFNQAIVALPESWVLREMRGVIFLKKQEWDKALADLNEAIKLNPKSSSAYMRRGEVYISKNDHVSGLADYDKALEVDPKSGWNYFQRGNYHLFRPDFAKGLPYFNKAIELEPKEAMYLAGRAFLYKRLGDKARARLDADEAMKLGWKTDEAK